ncbi:MAG: LacI family DNA-binding transcriptional regulator [Burkholderiales bacterium]|nr:LacI family transcriptional regulator [Burkholderiales bacterium]MDE1928807.1 LacI family DNA-binding transcriptional regulator [Burkholderiales bacterium]MDE2158471.1 LacI family DNA-binding transcriptional regulator [Burkholderiales bacterium]MDE2505554.1 LacI family DNA-binding transcriptional regulator [Burkholderiales bacterium]
MAVTIKDVARVAGVSVATVSRTLNGHSNVTEQTRAHVLGVVAELRFVPSSTAQSMITRRTHTIGALLPDLHGEYFSELIRGIDLAARARGLHLLVSSSHGDATEAAAALRAMNGRVDGLLVMSPHVSADFLWGNISGDLPAVLMNTRLADGRHASFAVDNHGGAHAMVRHLVERGHRSIAFIAGPESNFEAQERLAGYRAALAELLPGSYEQVLQGDFTQESGSRTGSQVIALTQRPTAIFAANDAMAIGCLSALNEAGLQVPRDIALAGFDDIPISRYVSPPLTTVRSRITELGGLALERLASAIEEPAQANALHQTLRADLVVRASTSPPGGPA